MPQYTLHINGEDRVVDVASDTPLLWVLRDELGLTGTKFGCGAGYCRVCTVHVDGLATFACQLAVAGLEGREVTTIEGLSADRSHPVQRAWIEEDVAQCGYCQPGQIMSAAALLAQNPAPTDEQIDDWMALNLCRCGTYNRIRRAVRRAAQGASDAG